ncbi:hypothetical protein Tco_0907644 [Tanacetum coccineum]|uniref:Uncharacterized protein n=1 Tax=Tanacetum coccineum TaxID=301880 RepID=A0ABQ5CRC1_9ASTR
MPLKSAPLTQADIRRMIKESVNVVIAAERARHTNARNDARGSGPVRAQDVAPAIYGSRKLRVFLESVNVPRAVENVVENESHFSLEVVDQDLSSLAMFTKHLMGRGGGVGSNSGVGEGKEEFMGGIGGGSFAKRSMVAKDGLGGDGFVVDGGRSPSTSSKDGEDGGVENKSSMGSRLIVTGEIVVEWLLEKLVGLPMCSPMVERMVDREEKRFLD